MILDDYKIRFFFFLLAWWIIKKQFLSSTSSNKSCFKVKFQLVIFTFSLYLLLAHLYLDNQEYLLKE